MGATTTHLTTVAELDRLPESGQVYYELRNGELVEVTRPSLKHHRIQRRLRLLLEPVAGPEYVVETEMAFRALPEHEWRVADVAVLSQERWMSETEEDIHGAPEIVIEVLSPSNTASEIGDKEELCLENGCVQFWVVDPKRRRVRVSVAGGSTTTYREGQEIPLFGGAVRVSEIFD